jgi:hypothetical protein
MIDGHQENQEKEILLGEGFHKITVTAFRNSPGDTLNFMMQSKMLDGKNVTKSELIKIDSKYLYNFPSFGLHGYFYEGPEWSGNPIRYEVINTNMCFGGGGILTESAEWKGAIKIPDTDTYTIFTKNNGYVRIIIDGKYYWEQGDGNKNTGDTVDGYFKGRHLQKVNAFNLTGGKHSIEIYSLHASLLELMWNKKGAANSQPVPVDALEPDYQITTK